MNYGILAAQLAASAASIAANFFIPPPFGQIVSMAIQAITNISIAGVSLSQGDVITGTTSLISAAMSSIPTSTLISKSATAIAKMAPEVSKKANVALMNIEKITKNINKKIDSIAPDKLLSQAIKKLSPNSKMTNFLQDEQLIMKKENELLNFGEIRTENKIFSTTFNKDPTSWIKSVTFEETKFFNRNKILGNLIIVYWANNDSRLEQRVNKSLNGNMNLISVKFRDARYKNDYVSGFCRSKSWGAYYMKNWMIGKPGRGVDGINTAFFFGGEWRVDLKLKNVVKQYANLDKALENYSFKVGEKLIGKTKVGSYLFSKKDIFVKTSRLMTSQTRAKDLQSEFFKQAKKSIKRIK